MPIDQSARTCSKRTSLHSYRLRSGLHDVVWGHLWRAFAENRHMKYALWKVFTSIALILVVAFGARLAFALEQTRKIPDA